MYIYLKSKMCWLINKYIKNIYTQNYEAEYSPHSDVKEN